MKYNLYPAARFFIFTFFTLLFLSSAAEAQKIVPDEQILREMIEYVGKVEAASQSTRPRISYNPVSTRTIRRNQAITENEKEASTTFALERRAFDILNEQRTDHGLAPLRWNEDMARVARLHSENMARYKFFSHTGRDGSTVGKRANSLVKRTWYSIGENIAFNNGFRKPVEMACQQWMTSPGHRQNILDAEWTESGIGASVAPDGSFYLTQVFIN